MTGLVSTVMGDCLRAGHVNHFGICNQPLRSTSLLLSMGM